MNEKIVKALGSVAAVAAIVMYVSYIPQIIGNLHGNRGDYIQPLAAAINCILWVGYGLLKKERDWPIAIANFPGVIFGLMAFFDGVDSFLKRNRSEDPVIKGKKDNKRLDRKRSSC